MTRAPLHLLIGTVFCDSASTLAAAVDSVLAQAGHCPRISLLLVDDASSDDWRGALGERLRTPGLHVRRVELQSTAKSRNFVLDEAQRAFPDVDYVCRLDADDALAGPWVLEDLAAILERARPDALLAGNLQKLGGEILERPNRATAELLDPERLVARLERMARGDAAAELPSCNTVVKRGLPVRYPDVASAEDHWFTVALLLAQPPWRVVVAPELIYSVYRLRGGLTARNMATETYLASRRALLAAARGARFREREYGTI